MQPTFFTRLGATSFIASQVMKALSAVFFLLIIWDFIQVPQLSWIHGEERSSPILLSALATTIAAALAVMGSVARPSGPGTRKWWANDMFYTILLGLAVIVGLVGWSVFVTWSTPTVVLTGVKLDIAILVGLLVVIQFVASLIADRIQDMMGPSTRTPPMPNPLIDSFVSNTNSIAAGGSVRLNWTTQHGTEAEIVGFGAVGLQGPLDFRPSGAAGSSVTITLVVRGAPGTTPATRDVTVTIN